MGAEPTRVTGTPIQALPAAYVPAARPAGQLVERRRMQHRTRVAVTRLLIILALIAGWEIYGRFFAEAVLVAPPSGVVAALFTTILSDELIRAAIGLTVLEVVVAYALSVVFGLLFGLLIGWTPLARRSIFPIVLLLHAIPQVILLPLFVLVFGLGPAAKIAFGFSHGIFPIVVNVVAGMRNVEPLYMRGAMSMGASRVDLVRHVVFPHMVPSFFAGLRLGMTLTLLGVILAELYVSTGGIGYFTKVFAETFDPAPLFALIATLAVIAITFNEIVRIAERRFTRWRS
jgi:NitT/TauT family transport system permease protein